MDSNYIQQIKKGGLEMLLLCLIGQKERYGYELLTEINRHAATLGYAKEGTIYPILYRLQGAGLLCCRMAPEIGGRMKKYYSLTEAGRQALQERIAFWRQYTQCIDAAIDGWEEEAKRKKALSTAG